MKKGRKGRESLRLRVGKKARQGVDAEAPDGSKKRTSTEGSR